MKYFLSMLILLSSLTYSMAQDYTKLFEGKVFSSKDAALPYRIMYPKNFNPKQKYPLIVFLHGAGERGSDNLNQLTYGASMFASDSVRDKYPAIVVFPQCEINSYWANVKINQDDKGFRSFQFFPEGNPTPPMELLVKFVKTMSKEKYVDKNRIYVGGLSMGGMGTFELLYRLPKVLRQHSLFVGEVILMLPRSILKEQNFGFFMAKWMKWFLWNTQNKFTRLFWQMVAMLNLHFTLL